MDLLRGDQNFWPEETRMTMHLVTLRNMLQLSMVSFKSLDQPVVDLQVFEFKTFNHFTN